MKDRNGGYTRILKIGQRLGDAAQMVILELVDYNLDVEGGEKKAKKKEARAKDKADKKEADKKEKDEKK
jgi:large subunit ribosomal protein L17